MTSKTDKKAAPNRQELSDDVLDKVAGGGRENSSDNDRKGKQRIPTGGV